MSVRKWRPANRTRSAPSAPRRPASARGAVDAQAIASIVLVWGYATWRILSDEAEVLDNARHELRAVARQLRARHRQRAR